MRTTTQHTHSNKTVLDGIAASDIINWNGKGKVYYTSSEPSELSEQDPWVQIVE